LADTAPTEAGIRHWSANSVKALLYREGLIGYDTDSGLWYCCVVAPKQDYPDGWQSDALVERKKRQAEREALAQTDAVRERFARRMAELAPDAPGLEERVYLEAAALAARADVREELDRLTAHVAAARALLAAPPAGRKLDFLMQEFMREANTLCSKSATVPLTAVGLELKSAVEQLREQVQNVE
jgi:uncharacterized protein (TIGR00255 family)